MNEADPSQELTLADTTGGVEIVDRAIDAWIVRFEPTDLGVDQPPIATAAAAATLASFATQLPELKRLLGGEQRHFRIVFSSEARKALLDGRYSLMRSGGDALPMAVDAAGRVAEVARVAPGVATGAGGTVAVGAALTVAWPLALAAGMGAAAAIAEQRWLEKTFGELQASLHRLEVRLRDNDFGVLEAANRLVDVLAVGGDQAMPSMLRLELAHAHHTVESVYWARRRFVERFKRNLEDAQNKHEAKTGSASAWAGSVASDLGSASTGTVDELVVFVAAMISRARTTAALGAALASDGDGLAALRLIDALHESLRDDYSDLDRRLSALAKAEPSVSRWRQMLPLLTDDEDARRARDLTRRLTEQMHATIGSALPAREATLALVADLGRSS